MLTPKELGDVEFARVFRGYAPEEVDDFISRLISEYEQLYQQNAMLQERADQLAAEAASRGDTSAIDKVLDAAKASAASLQSTAREEADATRARARAQAEESIAQAHAQAAATLQSAERRAQAAELANERLRECEELLRERVRLLSEACAFFLDSPTESTAPQSADATLRLAAAAQDEDDEA